MRFYQTLACSMLAAVAVAGVVKPTGPQNVTITEIDVAKRTPQEDAMQALDASVYVAKSVPTNRDLYNAWNLSTCAGYCNVAAENNPTLVKGSLNIGGTPLKDATFSMCNLDYRKCNLDCQHKYAADMNNWPDHNAPEPWLAISDLPDCISGCQGEAVRDLSKLNSVEDAPADLDKYMTFGHCNQKLSKCVRGCLLDYKKEVNTAFQEHH